MAHSTSSALASQHDIHLPALRERDEKLESLKAIVGKLAHDFNNFLVPMLGYVTLIKEDLPPNNPAINYANTMEGAARKTEGYLDTILLAVRPNRQFHPKNCNFTELLQNMVDEWKKGIPDNAHVNVICHLTDCSMVLDEQQWKNAVGQLLSNARFALATGGTLTVKLEPFSLGAEEAAALRLKGSEGFRLTVSDDGFGMPTQVARRAFEPFFSTRTNAAGAGLGLTIVHSVVQVHGGQVLLESIEDEGTTFTLYIPKRSVLPESPHPSDPAAPQTPNPNRHRSKILLVEDDPLVREVIKACLLKTSLEVCVGQDGEQGLRLFKKHAREIALVVTDITMPKMNGIEMYSAIREIDPQMRVIMVSGDAEGSREEALAKLGKERPLLIKKPFTLRAFQDVVRTYLS